MPMGVWGWERAGHFVLLYSGTLNPTGQMVALAWPSFHLGEAPPSARLPVLLGLQAPNRPPICCTTGPREQDRKELTLLPFRKVICAEY